MTPVMTINVEGDGVWPDLAEKHAAGLLVHLGNDAPPIGVSALEEGMASGAPSVALRLDLPDGRTVVAETSLVLFLNAADALRARLGDPRADAGEAASALDAWLARKRHVASALDHVAEQVGRFVFEGFSPEVIATSQGQLTEDATIAELGRMFREQITGYIVVQRFVARVLSGEGPNG